MSSLTRGLGRPGYGQGRVEHWPAGWWKGGGARVCGLAEGGDGSWRRSSDRRDHLHWGRRLSSTEKLHCRAGPWLRRWSELLVPWGVARLWPLAHEGVCRQRAHHGRVGGPWSPCERGGVRRGQERRALFGRVAGRRDDARSLGFPVVPGEWWRVASWSWRCVLAGGSSLRVLSTAGFVVPHPEGGVS